MSNVTLLRYTQAIASGITQLRIQLGKVLAGLYIRGSKNTEDYGPLVYTGDINRITPQAYKEQLDKLGYMFSIPRRPFESDEPYRQRIIFAIRVTTTKQGIKNVIKFIFENTETFRKHALKVEVRETYIDTFDGVTMPINAPLRESNKFGGIVIYIKPEKTYQLSTGEYLLESEYALKYPAPQPGQFDSRPSVVLTFTRNIDYRQIYSGGEFNSLRSMFSTMVAAGIQLDRIVFEQTGAGGNRGEYYAFEL